MPYAHHLPWPYARVLAHRGAGTLAPENTLAALRVGREQGYVAVEFDAVLAADEVPVLLHDATLERTTNGQGRVSDLTAEQLTALDAGSWFASEFAQEPVPRFDDALKLCREQGTWINIEIKPVDGFESITGQVVARHSAEVYADCLRTNGDRAENIDARAPLLSSFSPAALRAARATAPDLPRGWLTDEIPPDWQEHMESLGCVALHTNQAYLTADLARAVKHAGYWLFCYTVNAPVRAALLLSWGVDGFCTDRLDLIGAGFGG